MATSSRGLTLAFDPAADTLLSTDPFALVVGMLLDQQFPMERAFAGPYKIAQRLGTPDRLDPVTVAAVDPVRFEMLLAEPPAVHRYPAAMAGRIQALARTVIEEYGGDAAAIWTGVSSARDLYARVAALPGFGEQKSKILVALLGKQRGVRPRGWREVCAPYGEPGSTRSVADVVDADSLARVRAFKKEQKAAKATR